MRITLLCLIASLLLAFSITTWAADAEIEVMDSSFVQANGSRVLQQSIIVPATLDEVWGAFTTAEGLMSWAVPFAAVDFRQGGYWETSYSAEAPVGDPDNIRSRIISYLPKTMLSIKAEQAPPGFPHPELLPSLFSVFTFDVVDPANTRITVSGVGYDQGPGYDELFSFFTQANAWTLKRLHQRFAEGPVSWDQQFQADSE